MRIAVVAGAASLVFASLAEAGTIACSSLNVDVTSYVTNTSGCQYSTTYNNDPASVPIEVNLDAFFGSSNWTLAQQGVNQNASSGTWSVTGYTNFANYEWLIVFKNGSMYNLIGYLSSPGAFSGTWQTPFVAHLEGPNDPSSTSHDVSHISYYYQTSTQPCVGAACTPVPEPATMLLLGWGLLVLAAKLRKRRS